LRNERGEVKTVKLVNLTPHEIVLMPAPGGEIHIPPSGTVARCETCREAKGVVGVCGTLIPINRTTFGAITGLPDPAPDTLYIVSAVVAQAARRDDVVIVDDAVRDEAGRIIGARALARV